MMRKARVCLCSWGSLAMTLYMWLSPSFSPADLNSSVSADVSRGSFRFFRKLFTTPVKMVVSSILRRFVTHLGRSIRSFRSRIALSGEIVSLYYSMVGHGLWLLLYRIVGHCPWIDHFTHVHFRILKTVDKVILFQAKTCKNILFCLFKSEQR